MKFSLSGFLFEDNYRTTSLSFANFAKLANSAGYKGVELRKTQVNLHTPKALLYEYRAILDDQELRVSCMTPRDMPSEQSARNEFFKRYLDMAEFMKCEMLKINGSPEWIRYATEKASKRDILIGINTHIDSITETIKETEELISKVNNANFVVFYDPMHLAIAEEDYLIAIDKLSHKMCNVLLQCVRPAMEGEIPAIIHDGKIYTKTQIDNNPIQNWPKIVKKLKVLDYKGWITVIENSWPLEQREAVAIETPEYIKRLWENQ